MNNLARLFYLFCLVQLGYGNTPYFTELETLNPSQKASLLKLKQSASSFVPHDYMKEDIYLVKWLQATGFSARKAEDMLKSAIKWRQENKVDQWVDPQFFAEFERDYQSYHDGHDREGRPVGEAFYGDWNVRKQAIAGKIKQLTHYSLRGVERATRGIRRLQGEGKNVTQFILLLNMDGFNLINQACPTCLPLYLGFVSQYEKFWPNTIYRCILVNTPESFEIILNLIRPIMSPQTRANLKVFGSNKAEWKLYLEELIDPEQISEWFDGKKERKPHS